MRAEWWPKWGRPRQVVFMPLEQVKGDLYLLGSSVSAGGFVGGSMIYNPGSGDGSYASTSRPATPRSPNARSTGLA